jgi:CBS domain-containing protein
MICPDCKTDNIPGADVCVSCGHDLHWLDLPSAGDEFSEHLLNDRLGDLEAKETPFVSPTDPVGFAISLMQRLGTGCALVTQNEQLAGILTERDILLKAAGENVDLNAMTVREIMSPDPVVLREDDTLATALHKMSSGGFRHIPLVRDGRATRVISIRDVFRHVSTFIHKEPARAP